MNPHLSQLSLNKLKLVPCLMGITSMGLLLVPPTWAASAAQSEVTQAVLHLAQANPSAPPEELSPQIMEILCKHFPLNSRCGGAGAAPESIKPGETPEGAAGPSGAGQLETPPASVPTSGSESPSGAAPNPEVPSGSAPTPEVPVVPPSGSGPQGAGELETSPASPTPAPGSESPVEPPSTPVVPQGGSGMPGPGGTSEPGTPGPGTPGPGASELKPLTPDSSAAPITPASGPAASDGVPGPAGAADAPPATPPSTIGGAEEIKPGATDDPNSKTEEPGVAPKEDSPGVPLEVPGREPKPSSGAEESPTPNSANPERPTSVSDQELRQFAAVVPQLRTVVQKKQQEIDKTIDQSTLGRSRFNELNQVKQTPPGTSASSSSVNPKEQQAFEQVIAKIQAIQQDSKKEQEQIIQKTGMAPDRFVQILAAIQQNPELRTKVEQMIAN